MNRIPEDDIDARLAGARATLKLLHREMVRQRPGSPARRELTYRVERLVKEIRELEGRDA